jgi:lipopolysaccharide biosynthesis glycosyltransferase
MGLTLHIAAAADDNYAPHLAVVLHSALIASGSQSCVFHIVDNDLSDASRAKLTTTISRAGGNVRWYTIDPSVYQEGGLFLHVSRAAYYRVSLPELVPADVERLLYLDSDLIVMRDLSPLFEVPLDGNTIGAVQDVSQRDGTHLGLEENAGYFNSGVLLIDVHRWRERNVSKRVRERIEQGLPTRWADQCHLNAVLEADWLSIPALWNLQSLHLSADIAHVPLTPEIREAIVNPAVVHFCTSDKPWFMRCRHPYRSLYWRHLHQTPWTKTPAPDLSLRTRLVYLRNLFTYPARFPLRI